MPHQRFEIPSVPASRAREFLCASARFFTGNRPRMLRVALAAAVACAMAATHRAQAAGAAAPRPNLIVILADDLGYGDLGCYGSETIATPRLDRMAREGMRFTDFYVAAPFCSPSRAALLTGRLPARCGVPYVLFPTEHTGLPPGETTIAELLKPAGYATACVGKWHLGWRRELRPQKQGFDEYFGLLHTNDIEEWKPGEPFRQLSTPDTLSLRDGDRVVESPVGQSNLTQKYTERAVDFIRRNRERPFFLFLSHTMPHVPQHVSRAFEGKSRDGIYGDAIQELDWSTGQVLDALREAGAAERTLVVFLSDNGAAVRARKPNPKGKFPGRSFGGSNGPLRAGKGTTFEGGIRVPCIAWWPGTVPGGRTEGAPASSLDLFPTFARLAGAATPPGAILDGEDIGALLRGQQPPASPRMLFHYFGVQLQAVREGPWKLILPIDLLPARRVPSIWFEHQPGVFERQHRLWPKASLHDLAHDPGEKTDVAGEHPDIVARLLKKAREYDRNFQDRIAPVLYLPGPKQPAPGQVRGNGDDVSAWLELAK